MCINLEAAGIPLSYFRLPRQGEQIASYMPELMRFRRGEQSKVEDSQPMITYAVIGAQLCKLYPYNKGAAHADLCTETWLEDDRLKAVIVAHLNEQHKRLVTEPEQVDTTQ